MTSKEILCSGCGATVTQWVDGIWRDETESGYCSESTTLHHPSVLPPVAIAPEPQHTPGPWAFDSDREYFYSRSADFDNGEPFSAQIFKCPEEETPSLEDACLIAAAPDMLAALKAAQLELLQSRPSEYSEEVLGIIDAAISRAEGGKQ